MIEYFLNPQSVEALGWTLLHSVWQGAVFAILMVAVLIALRSYSAQSRYVVAVGLLCTFFLTLSGTFWLQWQEANTRSEVTTTEWVKDGVDDTTGITGNRLKVSSSDNEEKNILSTSSEVITNSKSNWLLEFREYYSKHLPLLVTIWFLGVLFLQLRFLGQLAYVQRLKHYGTQLFPTGWNDKLEELEGKLRIQKKVDYLTSMRIESPMVIGWLKPVVLMPRQLFTSLTETEIYAVLAHELAHIRREDFIVNLLQTFLCNIFFFHPGVWWMSNRIDDEREHCCDDLAVAATGPVTSYAKTLINVSEAQLKMQRNTPLAVAFSGKKRQRERGGFSDRVQRLFTVDNGVGTFREGFATAFILITALFLGAAATGSTAQALDSVLPRKEDATKTALDYEALNQKKLEENALAKTKIEQNTRSNKIQVIDPNELPVAAAVQPATNTDVSVISESVRLGETRVDALVMACQEGDFDFVKTLIETGIDVNGIGSKGFTPLMMATSKDEAEIVEYLLGNGADVNQSFQGWNALIEAADQGSVNSMKYLLKAGAEVNYFWTENSPTAISMAASEGKINCLRLLLEHGADINGIGASVPPLHIAAEEGNQHIIDYLISQKVSLDKKDSAGRTALMYAATEGKLYTVKKLMKAGADITIVDLNGLTARDYAELEKEYETRDCFKENNSSHYDSPYYDITDKRPAIHQATLDGLIEKVQYLVERGTDVNKRDDYGRTPLHIASAKNHIINMRVLMDLGADINAQDDQGRTPLMYAAADGKQDAVALLVSKVADVNIRDADGMRAYEWGRSGGNPDLAKFLGLITEKKAILDQKKGTNNGQHKNLQKEIEKRERGRILEESIYIDSVDIKAKASELISAAYTGDLNKCIQLIEADVYVDIADNTGRTALMAAVRSNHLDIVEFLIDEGANINKSASSGLTALHYAALENRARMTKLLVEKGVIVDATMRYSSTDGNYSEEPLVWEYEGATPLFIAVESGNTEIVSILINAGANKNHSLIRNEYRLSYHRPSYLTASEVMGLDNDFIKLSKFKSNVQGWTPLKHATLLDNQAIIALLKK